MDVRETAPKSCSCQGFASGLVLDNQLDRTLDPACLIPFGGHWQRRKVVLHHDREVLRRFAQ